METVILRPYNIETEGVAEYFIKGNTLSVKYDINSKDEARIMHLVALSSKKPLNMPYKLKTPVFYGKRASGKEEIPSMDLAILGYDPKDIDTFALLFKNKGKFYIASIGFSSLAWDINLALKRLEENSNPVEKAQKLLCKIKRSDFDISLYKKATDSVLAFEMKKTKSAEMPMEDYRWYDIDENFYIPEISAIGHITQSIEFLEDLGEDKRFLMGIKDKSHIAIGIKHTGENPFSNAPDCAVKKGGFWVVGILLKEDGQYFEKI